MGDREILDRLLKWAWDNVEYFSNPNTAARERWIVSEFLSVLAVQHNAEGLLSLEQCNKADVRFRDAFFQVKELSDPDLRRGKMYKDAYNSIKAAQTLNEVSLVGDASDIPPIANMHMLVVEKAKELACDKRYQGLKAELDLLIYVTRTRAALIQQHEIDLDAFAGLGWRSVSCVNTKQAVVLFSSPSAPEFIRERSQILMSASG